jgi:hypothetical protein
MRSVTDARSGGGAVAHADVFRDVASVESSSCGLVAERVVAIE